jgi:hypothetical protein
MIEHASITTIAPTETVSARSKIEIKTKGVARVGVSIRDKNKDGVWWVFVRHAGQRVSEQVGSEALAIEAKVEIERDIRSGK